MGKQAEMAGNLDDVLPCGLKTGPADGSANDIDVKVEKEPI